MNIRITKEAFNHLITVSSEALSVIEYICYYYVNEKKEIIVFCCSGKSNSVMCQYALKEEYGAKRLSTQCQGDIPVDAVLLSTKQDITIEGTTLHFEAMAITTEYHNDASNIVLRKSMLENYNDYSLIIDEVSLESPIKGVLQLLTEDTFWVSNLTDYSLLQLLNNRATFRQVDCNRIDKIIKGLEQAQLACSNYQVISVDGGKYMVSSNVDDIYSILSEYFNCYANVIVSDHWDSADIVAYQNDALRSLVHKLINDIEYIYRQKFINHPKLLVQGDGYCFFEIEDELIVGKKDFINPDQKEITIYVKNKRTNTWYVLLQEAQGKRGVLAAPRIIRALIPHGIEKRGGLNLHASAVAWKKRYSIIIAGEKHQGKTTNMITALTKFDDMDYQSNDSVMILGEKNLIAYGSHIPIGIRIGSVVMNTKLQNVINDSQFIASLRSKRNGYSYQFSASANISRHNETADNFTISFSPSELAEILGKSIIPATEPIAIVQPVYEKELNGFEVQVLSTAEKRRLIESNFHKYYNGVEQFWNSLLDCDSPNLMAKPGRDEVITKLIHLPGYVIKSNSNSISEAWDYLRNIISNE